MESFAQQRAKAAKWIYDRRDRVKWWRSSVLTERNNDPETLKLPPETAYLIFADMVQAGLLLPVIGEDGQDALTINPGREDDWRKVMNPRWHAVTRGGWRVGEWILSGIIGAILGVLATKLAGG